MSHKISTYIKQNPKTFTYAVILTVLFLVFTSLFSFCILQADDYYYASFLKGGLGRFISLTVDHFQTFNGRALVHFFAQIVLSLPRFISSLLNSLILFAIAFSAAYFTKKDKGDDRYIFIILFYFFLFLLGRDATREALMWVSAFYNYVFPAFLALTALNFARRNSAVSYIFGFLAGATTEQWGVVSVFMLACWALINLPVKKNVKTIFKVFSPALFALMGYCTIYLSPATRLRITSTGHTSVSGSLFDLPRLSEVFIKGYSGILILVFFTLLTVITAPLLKKRFILLYSGFLPLVLLVTSPVHKSYMATLIVFMCYLLLCFGVFYLENHRQSATFIIGALSAICIMIPTNTFEARITFPCLILLILACINIIFEVKGFMPQKALIPALVVFLILSVTFFAPTYQGFMQNSFIEKENLKAVKEARKTGELYYNIDYDKNYVTKQMFNDGWFYNQFLSLYSLEDATVFIESENSVSFDGYDIKGLRHKGEIYVPMRALMEEKGGSIEVNTDTVMTLDGKTLTLSSGMLTYKDVNGAVKYLVADENRILNFYTLYIKLPVVNDAFVLNIKTL